MAADDVKYTVTERGYDELRKKIRQHDELFGPPFKTAMDQIGKAGAASTQSSAPIGPTGRTVNNIRAVVSRAKVPRNVRIVESARTNAGFAYPRVLEFSPFAQNRYRKGANRHRLWMKRSIDRIQPVVDAAFKSAADGVERIWLA